MAEIFSLRITRVVHSGKPPVLFVSKHNACISRSLQTNYFRISNVGVDDFTEIIDPPRTCTLAIGSVTKRAAADDIDYLSRKHSSHVESQNSSSIDIIDYLTGTLPKAPQAVKSVESESKQNVKASQIVSAKLSIDERVIDTATASKFLDRISHYIQYPQKMIT